MQQFTKFKEWFNEEVVVYKGVWTTLWVITYLSFFRMIYNIGAYVIG